ncbi:uncharacterized protein Tco025E_09484 [Trypanosoma conorhini]|uniref:Uncharacterized protein n=1 Tax=Trypanosoma conorhini TaxID=83891 RepID=A0A422MVT0_9TRYP|nr:uncharacterized protein Tco025E_09484 [Trypanosoma conorhini]RNE97348.1 hypothetical protein Tco025E_09484 [Trypanosoma conorhini]
MQQQRHLQRKLMTETVRGMGAPLLLLGGRQAMRREAEVGDHRQRVLGKLQLHRLALRLRQYRRQAGQQMAHHHHHPQPECWEPRGQQCRHRRCVGACPTAAAADHGLLCLCRWVSGEKQPQTRTPWQGRRVRFVCSFCLSSLWVNVSLSSRL